MDRKPQQYENSQLELYQQPFYPGSDIQILSLTDKDREELVEWLLGNMYFYANDQFESVHVMDILIVVTSTKFLEEKVGINTNSENNIIFMSFYKNDVVIIPGPNERELVLWNYITNIPRGTNRTHSVDIKHISEIAKKLTDINDIESEVDQLNTAFSSLSSRLYAATRGILKIVQRENSYLLLKDEETADNIEEIERITAEDKALEQLNQKLRELLDVGLSYVPVALVTELMPQGSSLKRFVRRLNEEDNGVRIEMVDKYRGYRVNRDLISTSEVTIGDNIGISQSYVYTLLEASETSYSNLGSWVVEDNSGGRETIEFKKVLHNGERIEIGKDRFLVCTVVNNINLYLMITGSKWEGMEKKDISKRLAANLDKLCRELIAYTKGSVKEC